MQNAARYWTVAEYNTALPDLAGGLLANRLLWLGVGLLLLAVSYARFNYSRATAAHWWSRRRAAKSPARARPARTPRILMKDLAKDLPGRLSGKRKPAFEDLIENHTERINV